VQVIKAKGLAGEGRAVSRRGFNHWGGPTKNTNEIVHLENQDTFLADHGIHMFHVNSDEFLHTGARSPYSPRPVT